MIRIKIYIFQVFDGGTNMHTEHQGYMTMKEFDNP